MPETKDNLLANRIFLHYSVQHYFLKIHFGSKICQNLMQTTLAVLLFMVNRTVIVWLNRPVICIKMENSTLIIEPAATHCDNQPEIRKQIKNVFDLLKNDSNNTHSFFLKFVALFFFPLCSLSGIFCPSNFQSGGSQKRLFYNRNTIPAAAPPRMKMTGCSLCQRCTTANATKAMTPVLTSVIASSAKI